MLVELLKKLAKGLNDFGIPYMIIGGQAVMLYGEPRLTKDIDTTVGVGPEEVNTFIALCNSIGLRPLPDAPEKFVEKTFVLPAEDLESGFRVDFIFSVSQYEREAITRARPVAIDDVKVYFASVEDLIIHKIVAGRARDLEDVRKIILKI